MQKIQLNIIPFTPVKNKLTFGFYGEKEEGMDSIKWNKIFDEFPKGETQINNFIIPKIKKSKNC